MQDDTDGKDRTKIFSSGLISKSTFFPLCHHTPHAILKTMCPNDFEREFFWYQPCPCGTTMATQRPLRREDRSPVHQQVWGLGENCSSLLGLVWSWSPDLPRVASRDFFLFFRKDCRVGNNPIQTILGANQLTNTYTHTNGLHFMLSLLESFPSNIF